MFTYTPKTTVDELVEESMFGLIKSKTGIRTPIQMRLIEYCTTFTKEEDGRIKISSILPSLHIMILLK